MPTIMAVVVKGLLLSALAGAAPLFAQQLTAVEISGASLAEAAKRRTQSNVTYNGAYRSIGYPGGDVPANEGVCTDVVIRAYRALGIDLQVLVHEDMQTHFAEYPKHWGLKKPDPNIDHRRVPNLETFFERTGSSVPPPSNGENSRAFSPGDIVSFRLPGGLPHIGIVSDEMVAGTSRPYLVHNVGRGPKTEDVLQRYRLVGHYRYLPVARPLALEN